MRVQSTFQFISLIRGIMAENLEGRGIQDQDVQEVKVQWVRRAELTAEESIRRMETFPQRMDQIIAAVRKS